MSQINLNLGGKEIILLGTAHVSQQSCDEVKAAISAKKPDCVAIELDEQRFASLNDSEAWKNLDIIKVLREKKGFLLLANLVLSSFQKRMGANVGVKPGDEMRAGIDAAKELNIPCEMVDRPIQTTLRRAWAKNGGYGRIKLLSALFASAASKEEVSGEEIENLKNKSEMDGMMAELAEFMPGVKEVLIDERDFYLAAHIWKAVQKAGRKSVIAVLGAGHLPGVQAHLEKIAAGQEGTDTTEISSLPAKKNRSKDYWLGNSRDYRGPDCCRLCFWRHEKGCGFARCVGNLERSSCRNRSFDCGRSSSHSADGGRGRSVHVSLPSRGCGNVRRNRPGLCVQAKSSRHGKRDGRRFKRKRILQKPPAPRIARVLPFEHWKLGWNVRGRLFDCGERCGVL